MSADIQAVSDSKVKYTRGRRERGEEVEMFEREQEADVGLQTAERQSEESLPAARGSCSRAFSVSLGVLYLLTLAGIFTRYVSVTLEKDQLETRNKNLSNNYNQSLEQLSANNRQLQDEVKRLKEKTEDKWCPKGWTRFGSSCYVQLNEKETWSDSKKDCKNRGGDLVVINSPEEQEFLLQLNKNEESWIGLKTEQIKGEWRWRWRWVDGSELTHTFWSTESDGNPNIQDYATCCDRQGKWKRHRYYEEKGICEINLSYFP